MKSLLSDLYWEVKAELEKIHKSTLLLSERIALEKALTKLEAIKKIMNYCDIKASN